MIPPEYLTPHLSFFFEDVTGSVCLQMTNQTYNFRLQSNCALEFQISPRPEIKELTSHLLPSSNQHL